MDGGLRAPYGRRMTDRVHDLHPPEVILRIMDPVLRLLLRSPAARWMNGLAILTFTGRRTGNKYEIVVGWHELDGKGFVITPAPWRANFTDGAAMTLLHRGKRTAGRGELESDPAKVGQALNRLQDKGTQLRMIGIKAPPGHRLTESDITGLHRALVTFTPTG
jgi:hypothetical protein